MIIVSFATNDDHYRPYGEQLIGQCDRLGLRHHIEFFEPWAGKRETCIWRPEYMLRLLDEYREPLVWFDADGDILQRFEIPDAPAGFVDNPFPGNEDNPIVAGIFMVRDREVLEKWDEQCRKWNPGEIGSHRRLCWVSQEVDWVNMTPQVKGKIVLRGARGTQVRRL